MRKMYIQPKNEIEQVAPVTIMSVSSGPGESTDKLDPGPSGEVDGDAPRRRTPVF